MDILSSVSSILNYGLMGLSFLLAFLSYLLLRNEGKKERPSKLMLRNVMIFMALNIVLGLGAGLLEAGLVDIMTKKETTGDEKGVRSFMGLRLPQIATTSFFEPQKKTSELKLEGQWKAKWFVKDNTGDKYVPYADDSVDNVSLVVNKAEITCNVVDESSQLQYWLYGRISTENFVTLFYWSDFKVGTVFLQVKSKKKEPLKMEGWWLSHTRDYKVTEGWTVWTKK